MRIRMAHLQTQGINFAVFAADATMQTNSGRDDVLVSLTRKAQNAGFRVEKSALAFMQGGRITYHGTPDLVQYLANNGVAHWTHELDV